LSANTLTRLLEHPESIDIQDISKLEAIVKEYPYFSVAQVLLAVGMMRENHEKAQQQLQKAAAMAPNRNVLRKLCTQLPDEYVPQPVENEVIPEKTILIPEIDLGGTPEDLNREMALLEEKKKSLDELKAIIENKIAELEKQKKTTKKNRKKTVKSGNYRQIHRRKPVDFTSETGIFQPYFRCSGICHRPRKYRK